MFKRLEKRQKRREKEEELGLDEETKQVLGLQDTDTDESESSSGEDSSLGNESDNDDSIQGDSMDIDELSGALPKRKHTSGGDMPSEDEETDDEDISEDGVGFGSEGEEMDGEYDEDAPMGVMDALKSPIYDVPDVPETKDIRACIICPGKLFKNANMVNIHLESNSHVRRMKRYTTEVEKRKSAPGGLDTDDPREILRVMAEIAPGPTAPSKSTGEPSKRVQKKAAWKLKKKEKNAKKKVARVTVGDSKDISSPKDKEKKTKMKKLDAIESAKAGEIDKSKKKPNSLSQQDKQVDSDRPSKRRKEDSQPMDTTPDSKSRPSGSGSKSKKNKASKDIPIPPPLERHATSFYFADDEKPEDSTDDASKFFVKTGKKDNELFKSMVLKKEGAAEKKSLKKGKSSESLRQKAHFKSSAKDRRK